MDSSLGRSPRDDTRTNECLSRVYRFPAMFSPGGQSAHVRRRCAVLPRPLSRPTDSSVGPTLARDQPLALSERKSAVEPDSTHRAHSLPVCECFLAIFA